MPLDSLCGVSRKYARAGGVLTTTANQTNTDNASRFILPPVVLLQPQNEATGEGDRYEFLVSNASRYPPDTFMF
jgi:hypothetical protein